MPIDGLARALSGLVPQKARDYMDDLMPGKARDAIGALGDPEYWRLVRGNFGEAARGAARGISTNMLGAPVDLVNMAYIPTMNALGHPIDPSQTVGSSQWFAQQGDKRGLLPTGDSVPFKAGETLGPIAAGAAPDALSLLTAGAGKAASVAGQMAEEYSTMPKMARSQLGAIGDIPEYGIAHRPMQDAGGAARLHDLTKAMPEDVYGPNALQYYGSGDPREAGVLRILKSLRGKPDADVTIYRGVPAGAGEKINHGDWVTLDKRVAQDYAGGDGKVVEVKAKAKDITAWGDSLLEFGYYPDK